MKKLYLFLGVIFLSAVQLFAQNPAVLDQKNGFRDALFGMPLSAFSNMVRVDTAVYASTYIRTTDTLEIGDFKVSRITYSFYKDTFYNVNIQSGDEADSRGVLGVMNHLYGQGYQPDPQAQKYNWYGTNVFAIYDEKDGKANLVITDNIILKKKLSDDKLRQQQAGSKM
jgi:uncharacterized protein YjiK